MASILLAGCGRTDCCAGLAVPDAGQDGGTIDARELTVVDCIAAGLDLAQTSPQFLRSGTDTQPTSLGYFMATGCDGGCLSLSAGWLDEVKKGANTLETAGGFGQGVEVDGGAGFFLLFSRERNLVLFVFRLDRSAEEIRAALDPAIFERKHDLVRFRLDAKVDGLRDSMGFSDDGIYLGRVPLLPSVLGGLVIDMNSPSRDVVFLGFRFFVVDGKTGEIIACGSRDPV